MVQPPVREVWGCGGGEGGVERERERERERESERERERDRMTHTDTNIIPLRGCKLHVCLYIIYRLIINLPVYLI